MIKTVLFLVFIVSSLFCQKIEILDSAYNANSIDLLIDSFDSWSKYDDPFDFELSSLEKLNLTESITKCTYEIFEDFYDPKILKGLKNHINEDTTGFKVGPPELGDTLYNNIRYVLIQNEISISVYDSLLEIFGPCDFKYAFPIFTINLKGFHPSINIPNIKVIYLEDWLRCELGKFLLDKYIPIGKDLFWVDQRMKEGTENKLKFLNRVMRIFYDHKIASWIIETPPAKVSISFNKHLTIAEVKFTLINQIGKAYYKRKGNQWNFIESKITGRMISIH